MMSIGRKNFCGIPKNHKPPESHSILILSYLRSAYHDEAIRIPKPITVAINYIVIQGARNVLSLYPTTNSETMNPNFPDLFHQKEQVEHIGCWKLFLTFLSILKLSEFVNSNNLLLFIEYFVIIKLLLST